MKTTIYSFLLIAAFLGACRKEDKTPTFNAERLSSESAEAVGPYWTSDSQGKPVLCWTEKSEHDSLYSLKYAVYNPAEDVFDAPVTVPGSRGMSFTAESAAKVAFKGDGTVYALFAKSFNQPDNRFAGAIYYTFSTDEGRSWSEAAMLHSDHADNYGRNFFSVTRLMGGELGAIWLDGRLGAEAEGSALFFAKTGADGCFGKEVCVDRSTCECCRTEIITDPKGNIHIAYRGIQPSVAGEPVIRDMVYRRSTDLGESFSQAIPIGKDLWQIDGCPHTGPALVVEGEEVEAVWFTGAGVPGLYASRLPAGGAAFGPKELLSASGRHPQMGQASPEGFALVWDQLQGETAQNDEHPAESHHHSSSHQAHSAARSEVILSWVENGNRTGELKVNAEGSSASHPVVHSAGGRTLLAWVEAEGNSRSVIMYAAGK